MHVSCPFMSKVIFRAHKQSFHLISLQGDIKFQLMFAGVSRCLSSEIQKMFLALFLALRDVFTSAGDLGFSLGGGKKN